jgi:hypothetical protein
MLEMNYFFIWHIFLEVGKTQDLPSKIWQTLGDAWELLEKVFFSVFSKKTMATWDGEQLELLATPTVWQINLASI